MKPRKTLPKSMLFRVSVNDVVPEIWRKLRVSSDVTLAELHAILQVLMGWGDRHLYAFVIGSKRYSSPSDADDDMENRNSVRKKLSSVLTRSTKTFTYEYDFGDSWQIELSAEPMEHGLHPDRFAECLAGARHGPVEDSGGWRGYMENVKIYSNPKHRRHLHVRALNGPDFDSEAFDLARINATLNRRLTANLHLEKSA